MNYYTIGFPTTRDVEIKLPQGDSVFVPLDENRALTCRIRGRAERNSPWVSETLIALPDQNPGDSFVPFVRGCGRVTSVETKRFGSWYDKEWEPR